MININSLWSSKLEDEWLCALNNYWNYVKPSHFDIEMEINSLDTNSIKEMRPYEWYSFLFYKYYFWKYTAPNRYATTTKCLNTYKNDPFGLDELFLIKNKMFEFDKKDIETGLKIASSIKGLGISGASGLLAILFPKYFGTVDQFVVKCLADVDSLPEKTAILSMIPEQLKIKDAVIIINIMKHQAIKMNNEFTTTFWTPRKIDMILWSANR
jgi:hypothetical protein